MYYMPPGAWLSPRSQIIGAGPATHLSPVPGDKVHFSTSVRLRIRQKYICWRIRRELKLPLAIARASSFIQLPSAAENWKDDGKASRTNLEKMGPERPFVALQPLRATALRCEPIPKRCPFRAHLNGKTSSPFFLDSAPTWSPGAPIDH